MRIVALLTFSLFLSACSEFYSIVPRDVLKTVGNASIISTGLVMGTDKTIMDHIQSYRSGKDCSTVRTEKGRTYCREDEPNPIPKVTCYRTLADVMCYEVADPDSLPGEELDTSTQTSMRSSNL
ncbi:MAG: hypothetical protein COB46_07025 [Rhodospirillaceae bacterium]|nr:MAG: hypothetical protein COB46_07025 [Rhodospirillaceae bacterium]